MASPSWQVSGQYYETCSCDFVCPGVPGQMAVRPTKGSCTFAMAFQVERGTYGPISLEGLGFIARARGQAHELAAFALTRFPRGR